MKPNNWDEFVEKTNIGAASDEQIDVITDNSRCLLVEAGPGSGKTHTVITKIAYNIYNGISPNKILYITFTRKAAREAYDRLKKHLGEKAFGVTVCTIHKYALDTLRKRGAVKTGGIISERVNRKVCLGYAVEETRKNIEGILPRIDDGDTVWGYLRKLPKHQRDKIEKCLDDFKRTTGAYTFDDVLNFARCAIEKDDTKLFDWVYVDEVQDCPIRVAQLFCAVAEKSEHLCMIGDGNQSIYGFNGAIWSDTKKFIQSSFPNITEKSLTINFRSSNAVVKLSDAIARKQSIGGENVATHKSANASISWCYEVHINAPSSDSFSENEGVATLEIVRKLISDGAKYSDIAILFNQVHARRQYSPTYQAIAELFDENKIPYQRHSGASSSDIMEACRDLLAIIRSKHGKKSFRNIYAAVMSLATLKDGIGYVYAKRIADSFVNNAPIDGNTGIAKVSRLLNEIAIGDYEIDGLENAQLLVSAMMYYCKSIGSEAMRGVDTVALASAVQSCIQADVISSWDDALIDGDKLDSSDSSYINAVTLSTIHRAKGLEYKYVIVVDANTHNVNGGYYPVGKDGDEDTRKLYVAVSRAQDSVFILVPNDDGNVDKCIQMCGDDIDECVENVFMDDTACVATSISGGWRK